MMTFPVPDAKGVYDIERQNPHAAVSLVMSHFKEKR